MSSIYIKLRHVESSTNKNIKKIWRFYHFYSLIYSIWCEKEIGDYCQCQLEERRCWHCSLWNPRFIAFSGSSILHFSSVPLLTFKLLLCTHIIHHPLISFVYGKILESIECCFLRLIWLSFQKTNLHYFWDLFTALPPGLPKNKEKPSCI